jgi:hypothetical protein
MQKALIGFYLGCSRLKSQIIPTPIIALHQQLVTGILNVEESSNVRLSYIAAFVLLAGASVRSASHLGLDAQGQLSASFMSARAES